MRDADPASHTPATVRTVARHLADPGPRPRVLSVATSSAEAQLRRDVARGLAARPRWIPPAYLYDARGSALYEAIVDLEEYYPARTEEALLRAIAPALEPLLRHDEIVELGSGSSWKTRRILEAMGARTRTLRYVPIDVNAGMLAASAEALHAEFPALRVRGIAGTFEDALGALAPAPDRLFVFLGGTIGNLPPEAQDRLFRTVLARMGPGSHLLLGFDRRPHAGKPVAVVEAAYNDARGVTAEFDLNLLARLNRELDANFRLASWAHQAVYDRGAERIEMRLRSLERQDVTIGALGHTYEFEAGEHILTEISRKFDPDELAAWFERLGYRTVGRWTDPQARFGLALFAGPPGDQR